MKNIIFRLKITLAVNKNKYRSIEISSKNTLDTLSNTILDAFGFSKDHLYVFSMTRSPYDEPAYYHPASGMGQSASNVHLADLQLIIGQKFLYLYDFGDEWLFQIEVADIIASDFDTLPQVINGKGELVQYQDYEDDEENEDNVENDEYLTVKLIPKSKKKMEAILKDLPAYVQIIWMNIVSGKSGSTGEITMDDILDLEQAGLLAVEADMNTLVLKINCVNSGKMEFKCLADVKQRAIVEQIIETLIKIYDVIELDALLAMLEEYTECNQYKEADLMWMIKYLTTWKSWNLIQIDTKQTYLSFYCDEITEDILKARKQYPTKQYRSMSSEEKQIVLQGEWEAFTPGYVNAFNYFMHTSGWLEEDTEEFLDQAVKCIAMGYSEEEFLNWVRAVFAGNDIRLSIKTEKILKLLRKEIPSGALRGYTWGEYEKNIQNGFRQLSLFDNESPFLK